MAGQVITPPGTDLYYLATATTSVVSRRPDGATILNVQAFTATPTHTLLLSTVALPGNQTFTVNTSTNELTTAGSHGLVTGDGPYRLSSTITLPAGLSASQDYWVYVIDNTTIQLCVSYQNAVEKIKSYDYEIDRPIVVDITDTGTGVHTLNAALAAPTADGESNSWVIGIGYEGKMFQFAAPDVVTLAASNDAADVSFWWT